MWAHPAELESVRAEVNRLEAAIEVAYRQLTTSPLAAAAAEDKRDQNRALADAEAQKCQDLEALLAEVWRRIDDRSSLLWSSQCMLRHDVNWALNEYLRPNFDAEREHVVAFRSASLSQGETHDETLRQSVSSLVSYLDHRLSSPATVSNSGSTTSSQVGPVVRLFRSSSLNKCVVDTLQ